MENEMGTVIIMGCIGVIQGIYKDNGKEHGGYYLGVSFCQLRPFVAIILRHIWDTMVKTVVLRGYSAIPEIPPPIQP